MPIDRPLATVVARNLNDPQWPVRLMAIYLLATGSGTDFETVLDWAAQRDDDELVRRMAEAFRSEQPAVLPQSSTSAIPGAAAQPGTRTNRPATVPDGFKLLK